MLSKNAIGQAGFVIADVRIIDKGQGTLADDDPRGRR